MNRKMLVWIAAVSVAVFALLPDSGGILTLITLPFSLTGAALRWLSLSGTMGNIIAIVLYGALSLSPMLLAARKPWERENWLLVTASGLLFYVMYLMINPGLMPHGMGSPVGKVIYAGAVCSAMLSWLILKLLNKSDAMRQQQIYRILRIFFAACAMLYIVAGFGAGAGSVKADILSVRESNTMPGQNLIPTYLFLILSFGVTALECSLDATLFLRGAELLQVLESDAYGERCCVLAGEISLCCKRYLTVITLSNLALNLGQVLCASFLLHIDTTLHIPLSSMALVFGTMALAKLLSQGRELKEDNDLFI